MIPPALTLVQQANHPIAAIHYTAIQLRKCFLSLRGAGDFSGGVGAMCEVTLEEGDIINIPTGIFRGFENIGTDYGMIMAVLGGDDAGGGVVWAPQVIQDAAEHGLVLGKNGKLYDTKKGAMLPDGVEPMPVLDEAALKNMPEPVALDIIPRHVARYLDLMGLAGKSPAKVVGEDAILPDKPGFDIEFITRGSLRDRPISISYSVVLMPMHGHWKLSWEGGSSTLNPGDTCLLPAGFTHTLKPSITGEASLYRVISNDDPAGPTWTRK